MAKTNAKPFRTGVIFGKFYPLTRGHQFLIEKGLSQCERLTVCVSHRPSEMIPVHIRHGWIARLFPQANVVTLESNLPYFINECDSPDTFYRIWEKAVIDACGCRPQAAFTSEPSYAPYVVDYLKSAHVVVDPARATVPISATKVRADPFAMWDYLDPAVRSYFVKTICLYGPESTGKTTLCEKLALHFNTVWQPEFAREYLGERHCEYEDMEPIAEGHLRERSKYKEQANRILFVDSDTMITRAFSMQYYGKCPQRVEEIIHRPENQNDLYLFTTIDVPWVADTSRDLGTLELRTRMQNTLLDALRRHGTPCVMIDGADYDARFQRAVAATTQLLAQEPAILKSRSTLAS